MSDLLTDVLLFCWGVGLGLFLSLLMPVFFRPRRCETTRNPADSVRSVFSGEPWQAVPAETADADGPEVFAAADFFAGRCECSVDAAVYADCCANCMHYGVELHGGGVTAYCDRNFRGIGDPERQVCRFHDRSRWSGGVV